MDLIEQFNKEKEERIKSYETNAKLQQSAYEFLKETTIPKYSYNFTWLNRPIIQYPTDIVAMQEIIWEVKPDLIFETGIAHGGTSIFYSSMISLLKEAGYISNGKVISVDIDIRPHNRAEIEKNPFYKNNILIQGSSIEQEIVEKINNLSKDYKKILVCLDSNHTHEHVLSELYAYAPLTSISSYCVVFDSMIEDLPNELFKEKNWGPGNNPKTAIHQYLKETKEKNLKDRNGNPLNFQIDKQIQNKLLITTAMDGYLKRV